MTDKELIARLRNYGHVGTVLEAADRIEALVDEVKRLGWEPIDTAPKDGTRVILWRGPAKFGKQSEMVIAEWHGGEWQWPDEAENPCTHGEWSEEDRQGGYYSDGRYFTHWMPLPTAPVDASQMPDPVINDPRVKALVDALRRCIVFADGIAEAAEIDMDETEYVVRIAGTEHEIVYMSWTEVQNLARAALRAIGGEA